MQRPKEREREKPPGRVHGEDLPEGSRSDHVAKTRKWSTGFDADPSGTYRREGRAHLLSRQRPCPYFDGAILEPSVGYPGNLSGSGCLGCLRLFLVAERGIRDSHQPLQRKLCGLPWKPMAIVPASQNRTARVPSRTAYYGTPDYSIPRSTARIATAMAHHFGFLPEHLLRPEGQGLWPLRSRLRNIWVLYIHDCSRVQQICT